MPLLSRFLRQLPLLAWSLVVAVALLTPGDELPSHESLAWLDKPAHALLFALHGLLLGRSLPASWSPRRAATAVATLSGLYALVLEVMQIWLPPRGWEWWDLAAGFAGICAAALWTASSRARLESNS